jgi:aminopeptidase N
MPRLDPHSYNDDTQAETERLALKLRIDFTKRVIEGSATLNFRKASRGTLDLDTRDLEITDVFDLKGQPLEWKLHPADPILGARLAIELPAGSKGVLVRYTTSPNASALQWLEPSQTKGKRAPFLFSQCQAIHARSIVPLQDTPRLRIQYSAEVTVPKALRVVMAAAPMNRVELGDEAIERWVMPQPIPPYLFAFAVGDLASRDLSPRCRVWGEPETVDAAAYEFADVEKMIAAAERLFGPYDWDRFDILTMPPSFPYGGMENPRLTFLTPTVIAGDRSLVGVVAHELAHSWTGNLVTNANAEHFWLNEGFTMYAERRIVEELDGPDMAALQAMLGRRELDASLERFKDQPELTKLRTHLEGVDPDNAYSLVPYEKGYFFLATLEQAVGRPKFEQWLKTYLDKFRFGAITTEDFLAHFEAAHPGVLAKVNASEWLDGTGIPEIPRPRSEKVEAIERLGATPPPADVAWTATEWNLYLESVPRPAPLELCKNLDARLTSSTNYDVLVAWLDLALQSRYTAVLPRVEEVVAAVGRMKFLRPLYTALAKNPETRETAARLYERLKPTYHPIAQAMVESVLEAKL